MSEPKKFRLLTIKHILTQGQNEKLDCYFDTDSEEEARQTFTVWLQKYDVVQLFERVGTPKNSEGVALKGQSLWRPVLRADNRKK